MLFAVLSALLTLTACTENTYETDVIDIKASKINQIGTLFDNIARQPEMANELMATAAFIYTDYTALLPLSDKAVDQRGTARGNAIGKLLVSISRQPEAFEILDKAAERFLGKYDAVFISDELLEYSKVAAQSGLIDALARQPEAKNSLNAICVKYLNYSIIPTI